MVSIFRSCAQTLPSPIVSTGFCSLSATKFGVSRIIIIFHDARIGVVGSSKRGKMMRFAGPLSARFLARLHRCRHTSALPQAAPSSDQLRAHALQNAVPMVGFGIVDCVVMTQVGSTMDAVLGATLGISSITAAAIGLFCSDSCGVLFGGTIESVAGKFGLPAAHLTAEQLELPTTKRSATMGRLFGVQLGVVLGSTTLLLQKPKSSTGETKPEDSSVVDKHSFETIRTTNDVVVFTSPGCPFGRAVGDMLLKHNVTFVMASLEEHDKDLLKVTGSMASPSIWVCGKFIGNRLHQSVISDLIGRKC